MCCVVQVLTFHHSAVQSMGYSPDNRFLLSIGKSVTAFFPHCLPELYDTKLNKVPYFCIMILRGFIFIFIFKPVFIPHKFRAFMKINHN